MHLFSKNFGNDNYTTNDTKNNNENLTLKLLIVIIALIVIVLVTFVINCLNEVIINHLHKNVDKNFNLAPDPSNFENTKYRIEKPFIGCDYYRMSSNPRGFCLIINIIEFINPSYDKRTGSEKDSIYLKNIFQELHFTVKVIQNQTRDEILETIKAHSKSPELRKHDAFVLFVLSHGDSGYFVDTNGHSLQFEDIVALLNNESCPQLISKPKLIFFDCCRGVKRDMGLTFLNTEIDTNAVTNANSFKPSKVPLDNDIMICYSTVDGYVSWRNPATGSWFGKALYQSLKQHSRDKELHHILIKASEVINDKETKDGEKQVIEWIYRGWNKEFYFFPAISNYDYTNDDIFQNLN